MINKNDNIHVGLEKLGSTFRKAKMLTAAEGRVSDLINSLLKVPKKKSGINLPTNNPVQLRQAQAKLKKLQTRRDALQKGQEAAKLKALEKKKNEAAEIATGRAIHAKILSAPKPGQMQQLMRTRPGMETGTLMTRGARRTIAPRPGQTRKQVESAPVLGRLTPEKMRAKAMQDMITNRASSTTRGADTRMAREALKEQQAMLEARKAALRNIREGRALKASIKPKPLSTTSYVGGAQAPVTIPTMPSKATAFSPVKREPIPGMRDFDKHPIKLRFLR